MQTKNLHNCDKCVKEAKQWWCKSCSTTYTHAMCMLSPTGVFQNCILPPFFHVFPCLSCFPPFAPVFPPLSYQNTAFPFIVQMGNRTPEAANAKAKALAHGCQGFGRHGGVPFAHPQGPPCAPPLPFPASSGLPLLRLLCLPKFRAVRSSPLPLSHMSLNDILVLAMAPPLGASLRHQMIDDGMGRHSWQQQIIPQLIAPKSYR